MAYVLTECNSLCFTVKIIISTSSKIPYDKVSALAQLVGGKKMYVMSYTSYN